MKVVGFIGAYDKADLILYIAKILSTAKKKILIIDGTTTQKMRYTVPTITPTKTYITEFEGIDVAIGFKNENEIRQYLGIDSKPFEYDIALLDIDNYDAIKEFNIINNYRNLFVTAFDLYSLKKGVEILSQIDTAIQISKVLFSKNMLKEENEYLDFLTKKMNVMWDKTIHNFPLEFGNYAVSIENQVVSRIKIKGLSNQYKEALQYLIESIFGDEISSKDISQTIKILEREA